MNILKTFKILISVSILFIIILGVVLLYINTKTSQIVVLEDHQKLQLQNLLNARETDEYIANINSLMKNNLSFNDYAFLKIKLGQGYWVSGDLPRALSEFVYVIDNENYSLSIRSMAFENFYRIYRNNSVEVQSPLYGVLINSLFVNNKLANVRKMYEYGHSYFRNGFFTSIYCSDYLYNKQKVIGKLSTSDLDILKSFYKDCLAIIDLDISNIVQATTSVKTHLPSRYLERGVLHITAYSMGIEKDFSPGEDFYKKALSLSLDSSFDLEKFYIFYKYTFALISYTKDRDSDIKSMIEQMVTIYKNTDQKDSILFLLRIEKGLGRYETIVDYDSNFLNIK